MNQPFHLFRLQQIDSQLSQVDHKITELDRLLAGDETIREARAALDENSKALQKAQQALKKAETSVKDQALKVEQTEATLYSGKVKNPKELQDLHKDIVSLKKHQSHLEDQQLEAMMALEEAEQRHAGSEKALNQIQASFAEKCAGWSGQRDVLIRTREKLLSERGAALSLVDADSLKAYDRLRLRKSGVAVTTVRDGACSVCGAPIRPSEVQNARAAQDFVYCTNCGRILYAG